MSKSYADVRNDKIQTVGKPGPDGRKSVKLLLAGEVRVANDAELPKDTDVQVVIGDVPGPYLGNGSRVVSIELPNGDSIKTL